MPNPNFKPQSGRTSRDRRPAKPLTRIPSILIVCQGEKTEPNYFRSFRVADVEIAHANGDPSQVVRRAEKLYSENDERDAIWCVFDKDDFTQFDQAIRKVETLGKPFRVAWSNECFELWYLLHFEFLQSSLDRKSYEDKLTKHLSTPYVKNDVNMRNRLRTFEEDASFNVEKLRSFHEQLGITLPSKCCPMTTVNELVAFLRGARTY